MGKSSSLNKGAPYGGSLTLAHTGDPAPVTWIDSMIAPWEGLVKRGLASPD
jgi:hypothetical protein